MQFYKSIQRYCRFINSEATIQVREMTGSGRAAIARQRCACRTAREGNMITCRNVRCKYINGGRGEDPFLCVGDIPSRKMIRGSGFSQPNLK